ncbi:MAG: flagellar motor protein MotB [bacterium]|nr:flagellar motor protein MotB [bacterium]
MKKKQQEESGGAPGWMVTFADMMTLLLCFFVLLLSFSSIQESEFNKAMGSLQAYLGILTTRDISLFNAKMDTPQQFSIRYSTQAKKVEEQKAEKVSILALSQDIKDQASSKEGMGGSIEVIEMLNSLRIRIPSAIAFESGEYGLSKSIKEFFSKIAYLIKDLPYTLTVEGHTDNVPIFSEKYESNWELSSARSLEVVHYFTELGIPGNRLIASAYGETRPLEPNDTIEGKQRNRRVELLITLEPEDVKNLMSTDER